MPRGDRTGPEGEGPATGRGLGYCTGHDSPGFTKGAPRGIPPRIEKPIGYRPRRGRGRGRGRRGRF